MSLFLRFAAAVMIMGWIGVVGGGGIVALAFYLASDPINQYHPVPSIVVIAIGIGIGGFAFVKSALMAYELITD